MESDGGARAHHQLAKHGDHPYCPVEYGQQHAGKPKQDSPQGRNASIEIETGELKEMQGTDDGGIGHRSQDDQETCVKQPEEKIQWHRRPQRMIGDGDRSQTTGGGRKEDHGERL
jgi:hypothetical protein